MKTNRKQAKTKRDRASGHSEVIYEFPAPEECCVREGNEDAKVYDLEERTFRFARRVRAFVRRLPQDIPNQEDIRQLVKASGSVGANYIEANESLSKKDFAMRVKISRKESKESRYWLRLLFVGTQPELERERSLLVDESTELLKIFSAIVRRSESA